MGEKTEREEELVRRGRSLAERLFRQMPRFDRFDVTLMHIDSILAAMDEIDVKYVITFYDLSELKRKLRSYADRCNALANRIDELMEKGMRG